MVHLKALYQTVVASLVTLEPLSLLDIIAKSILGCDACTTSPRSASRNQLYISLLLVKLLSRAVGSPSWLLKLLMIKVSPLRYEEINERPAMATGDVSPSKSRSFAQSRQVTPTRPRRPQEARWLQQATSS